MEFIGGHHKEVGHPHVRKSHTRKSLQGRIRCEAEVGVTGQG